MLLKTLNAISVFYSRHVAIKSTILGVSYKTVLNPFTDIALSSHVS